MWDVGLGWNYLIKTSDSQIRNEWNIWKAKISLEWNDAPFYAFCTTSNLNMVIRGRFGNWVHHRRGQFFDGRFGRQLRHPQMNGYSCCHLPQNLRTVFEWTVLWITGFPSLGILMDKFMREFIPHKVIPHCKEASVQYHVVGGNRWTFHYRSTKLKKSCYTGWGGHLFRRFCDMFSKSSACVLGQHGSCSAAQQPGNSFFFTKTSEQVAAPRGRGLSALRLQSLRRVRRTSDKESVLRMFMWEEGVVSTRSNATKKMVDSSNRAQCRRINFHLDLWVSSIAEKFLASKICVCLRRRNWNPQCTC